MSKRFVDTELFLDPWFIDLSKDGKILWMYMITMCDHAGIIEMSKKLVEIQTGINSLETVIKELGNRLVRVNEQLTFFIPKFIEFQYPGFPKSSVKQQEGAIKLLKKYDLLKHLNLSLNKELLNSYGNDNDNGNGKGGSGGKNLFEDFWVVYDYDVDRELCEKLWVKISDADKVKIMDHHVRGYIISTPDKKFRKRPSSYLNLKSWNDEIVGVIKQTTLDAEEITKKNRSVGY